MEGGGTFQWGKKDDLSRKVWPDSQTTDLLGGKEKGDYLYLRVKRAEWGGNKKGTDHSN